MDKIRDYLTQELQMKPFVANMMVTRLCRYDDIRAEFYNWLDTRSYQTENPLQVEGYTAADIAALAPFMDASAVYGFLVTLRENPKDAKDIIARGFPRK